MFCNNIMKGIQCTRRFSLNVSRGAIQRPSSFYEADRREQDMMPSYMRQAITDKTNEQFTEIREDNWFMMLMRSFELRRAGLPRRFTWNKDTISWDNIVRSMRKNAREYNIFQQRFVAQRHQQLGNEIAAAHFLVYRGAAVKFQGVDQWAKMKKGAEPDTYDEHLPKDFDPSVFIECINADNVELYYEGLDNIQKLAQLKWLSLRNSKHFNDWCLDKITNEFSHSLEYLNLSGCKQITYNGLSAVCKLTNLTTLVVEDMNTSNEFELTCVMLQQAIPNLNIVGVNYLDLEDTAEKDKLETTVHA